MAKKKKQRIVEFASLPNARDEAVDLRGHWNENFFYNNNTITLELACGQGEYTLALAKRFPQCNFIGIDIKGARLWHGARQALDSGLANVAFVRTAIENLPDFFANSEIAEIWIPFPDPHPTFSRRNRRLTSPRFLTIYRQVLQPEGVVHLKTDDDKLFHYTLSTLREEKANILQSIPNLASCIDGDELLQIRTKYEIKHLKAGKTIKYLQFRFGQEVESIEKGLQCPSGSSFSGVANGFDL